MTFDPLTEEFVARHRGECALHLLRWWQALWLIGLLVPSVLLLLYRWDYFVALFSFLLAAFYFAVIGFRSVAVGVAVVTRAEHTVSSTELAVLYEESLPVYTILVPLYREAAIVRRLVDGLTRLDYPRHKLDVKLILEPDDTATRDALAALPLPPGFEVVVVPDAGPRTKPKACNYGLAQAHGEFVVIYDAEDRPDPDQLRKVVWAFYQAAPETVCVQAKLNYYNARQNLLTRWFAVEYSAWFDLFLPGLQALHVPIPLGGTSNHFRTAALREIGGWDPFNVTEDCDLGVRLYRRGYRTEIVDSTTWEEANSRLWNWLRQRSRWVKGFFQTHFVHTRYPLRAVRSLGVWGYAGFLMTVGAVSWMLLLNLVCWLIGLLYLGCLLQDVALGHQVWQVLAGDRDEARIAWQMIFLGPREDAWWSTLSVMFFIVSVALLLANLIFVFINCLACCQRRAFDLLPAALLSPFYWALISLGALKGFLQLFTNPFYWEKTVHGLDEAAAAAPPPPPPAGPPPGA